MEIKSVQELEDKTVVFSGSLNASEHAIVIGYGLNTLMSLGLMSLVPSVELEDISLPDENSLN